MSLKKVLTFLIVFMAGWVLLTIGCYKKEKHLIVYAGKGMRVAVEAIVHSFEFEHHLNVDVIYGGSQTLLSAIQKTGKGDIFIPGNLSYMKKAGDLVTHYQIVAEQIPVVAVRIDNDKQIHSFDDLTKPGIRLAVGNKMTCALGNPTEDIFIKTGKKEAFLKNVIIESSTANELLNLVIDKEVDASITFAHLLQLPKAEKLRKIDIPFPLTNPMEIPTGILSVSENKKIADLFYDFMATEGRTIFKKHGFGE